MAHNHETPTDEQVLHVLEEHGAVAPSLLLELLCAVEPRDYDIEDCRRAVVRCLNRGLIRLDNNMALEAVPGVMEMLHNQELEAA